MSERKNFRRVEQLNIHTTWYARVRKEVSSAKSIETGSKCHDAPHKRCEWVKSSGTSKERWHEKSSWKMMKKRKRRIWRWKVANESDDDDDGTVDSTFNWWDWKMLSQLTVDLDKRRKIMYLLRVKWKRMRAKITFGDSKRKRRFVFFNFYRRQN